MEIFKFCEIAQMKNLKEKMHWAVFLADRLQSRQTDFMHIFNFFQTFFSSIHFEKLELYNQSIKQRQHRTKLYTTFSQGMHDIGKFRKACWILSNFVECEKFRC